ncbi:MAG TPA: type II toxin-antitoxin system VapC family toxin [Pyrinomonadaceae bacterium]|nr:type II toxin-antitoxin system VapC family toxin [Pyrinomonadaceae bacterium]
MSRFLPDTNVFSKVFKGDLALTQYVESLDAVIDTTVYIECLQGSKSNQEKQKIKKALDNFPLLLITPEVSVRAIDLIDKYSNSHGLLLPDALIAATALENDLTIVTYNVNDFKFIQDLKWQKPPV